MAEPQTTKAIRQKAFLVGAIFPYSLKEVRPLEELTRLANTADIDIVGEGITQKKAKPENATFFGKGKIQEIKEQIEKLQPDLVICDNDLSPSQARKLEEALDIRVMDRSELIIEIFVRHASSHQAQLQVELAKLKYTRPRLKRMWTHLSRTQGGIGVKGDGETQLEVDRRIIKRKIFEIEEKIKEISARKEREIETRSNDFTVALVGYTNAGKSTVLKNLSGCDTYIEDKLFATLDTTTRKVRLEKDLDIFLTDTVGFIRELPHHLVASFKATLLEAKHAKLLLHIVDTSSEEAENQILSVNTVLSELEIKSIPIFLIFNKIDLLQDETRINQIKDKYPEGIFISATENTNIEELKNKILELATANRNREQIRVHLGAGKVLSLIETHTKILDTSYEGEYATYTLEVAPAIMDQIRKKNQEYELKALQ